MFDGFYEVIPKIRVEPGGIPNGNLTVIGSGMGVAVSQGLLNVKAGAALTFGLAHELAKAGDGEFDQRMSGASHRATACR